MLSSSNNSQKFELAKHVRQHNLIPQQQPTSIKLQRSCDFYQQYFIKHPYCSDFHSRAEFLQAGLHEGNPAVSAFVPQPFRLYVFGRSYTPDCYVMEDGNRRVQELRPEAVFDEGKRMALEHFFALRGMQFEVVSNESIYDREIEAENWIDIVRTLYRARDWSTDAAELSVLDYFYAHGECTLGDIVDVGDREGTFASEVALFRLMHRGIIQADLFNKPLDYDTGLKQCNSRGVNV